MVQEIVNANPALRKKVYAVYGLVGFVLGSVQVGFGAADAGQPVWLTVALAVFAYAGVAFGYAAGSKVEAQPVNVERETSVALVESPGHVTGYEL